MCFTHEFASEGSFLQGTEGRAVVTGPQESDSDEEVGEVLADDWEEAPDQAKEEEADVEVDSREELKGWS